MTLEKAIEFCEDLADCDCYNKEQREFSNTHWYIAQQLRLLKRITDSGDCNICKIRPSCRLVPKLGELVRYNCPFYESKRELNNIDFCTISIKNLL